MLIHINRKIFNALPEDLQLDYICENIERYLDELINRDDVVADFASNFIKQDDIADYIHKVISKNEQTISEIGLQRYFHNDMTADQYVSGYYYPSGRILLCPFDWSMDDENDENFNYSFQLAVII